MSTPTPNPSLFHLLAAQGRRIAAAGALAIFGLASAGTAVAAPATIEVNLEPRLAGPVHWSATSGNTNYISTVLEPTLNASGYAARSFEWSERSDSPCWAKVGFTPLGDFDWISRRLNNCDEHRASIKRVSRGQANEAITGIEVCLTKKSSSSKDRLKGVRLWGRTIDPETGALGPVNGPAKAQRKRCRKWSGRVNCPSGEVAGKFKIFSGANDTRPYMQGISLGCRRVEMRPAMQAATIQPPR